MALSPRGSQLLHPRESPRSPASSGDSALREPRSQRRATHLLLQQVGRHLGSRVPGVALPGLRLRRGVRGSRGSGQISVAEPAFALGWWPCALGRCRCACCAWSSHGCGFKGWSWQGMSASRISSDAFYSLPTGAKCAELARGGTPAWAGRGGDRGEAC